MCACCSFLCLRRYADVEFKYKVDYRNRTGALRSPICDRSAPYGCCTACAPGFEDCCLCRMDGDKNVSEVLERGGGHLQVSQWALPTLPHSPSPSLSLSLSLSFDERRYETRGLSIDAMNDGKVADRQTPTAHTRPPFLHVVRFLRSLQIDHGLVRGFAHHNDAVAREVQRR